MNRNHLGILLALCLLATANAPATVLYVDLNSATPTPPFTNWSTAAVTIQDAVDAAVAGDQILVTDGVYQSGGKAVFGTMTNRVALDKPVALLSVNGPEFTIIQGNQAPGITNGDDAIRCVYLTNDASLSGFTLTNGATRATGDLLHEQDGGGLWCETTAEVVSNCVLIGNSAFSAGGGAEGGMLDRCTVQSNSAFSVGGAANSSLNNCVLSGNSGGGAGSCTLNNCVLSGNSGGGGAVYSTLYNCTLTGNSAENGGGASWSILNNCVLTGNHASRDGGGAYGGSLINCRITNNAAGRGGGVFLTSDYDGGRLINCVLARNSAASGGGVCNGWLTNCTLERNIAYSGDGGGALSCKLDNCTLTGNRANNNGGGLSDSGNFSVASRLNNCTLTGNFAYYYGGGVFGGILNNCVLMNNSAGSGGGAFGGTFNNCQFRRNSASGNGGGVYVSTLSNCTLTANSATNCGGGAVNSTMNNCTLAGNSANLRGGGTADSCFLTNCIVYYNRGGNLYDLYGQGAQDHCCITPLFSGTGNFTNAPVFVDTNGWVNLRLQSNSPCINAGTNVFAAGSTDLDGRPRIQDGTVDVGAYEFQPGANGEFIGWLQQSSLPTDGSADYADSDGDHLNNWQEWIAGTIPTDASSALRLLAPANGVSGVTVTWQSVSNRTYFLERATNLAATPPFSLLSSNLLGQAGTTSFTDTNAVGPGPFFYRVGVQQ